jgi:hypothetical protein
MSNASAALMTNTPDPTAGNAGSSTPPPASSTPPAGGGSSTPPAPSSDWTTTLAPELKGYVENKGFKDPSMVLESYRNLEKLMGAPKDRLLKLPENLEDPNAMNEIYEKLGVPKEKDAYKIEGEDKEFAEFAKSMFHEAKLTPKQAELVTKKLAEFAKSGDEKSTTQAEAEFKQQELNLRGEWANNYDANVKTAQAAVKAFGLDGAAIDKLEQSLGFDGVMKFLHTVGSKLGVSEKDFVLGGKQDGFGGVSPAAAESKMQELMADPVFSKRYFAGDKIAVEQMTRLHAIKGGFQL